MELSKSSKNEDLQILIKLLQKPHIQVNTKHLIFIICYVIWFMIQIILQNIVKLSFDK